MVGEAGSIAILRHVFGLSREPMPQATGVNPIQAKLPEKHIVTIGREPSCQIVIDSNRYGMVSRRHAEIRYAPATQGIAATWWICDLSSANGSFINQQPLQGCRTLQSGDVITLGQDGPVFIFELVTQQSPEPTSHSPSATPAPVAMPAASAQDITLTQLFPILSSGLDLRRKAYLMPGAIAVTFVVALFMAIESPRIFNLLLASFLATGGYYLIYRLCGKHKPTWLLLGTAIATVGLLRSPLLALFIWIFRDILPGAVIAEAPFGVQLFQMFVGAGLMEELLKALPLFFILGVTTRMSQTRRNQIGIVEPLDGILLGAASAIGFTLFETLGQYVPDMIQNTQLQAGPALQQLRGLQLLIPRLLGAISGHVAYSGYFGYFIGLAVLRPQYRWQILLTGYLSAAALHALWNTMGGISPMLLAIVGMLSYAFLAAAIVKARSLSPNRHKNFATRLKEY